MLRLNQGLSEFKSNQFLDFIWSLLRGLAQKGQDTNVGAGSLWPNSKPHSDNVPTLGLYMVEQEGMMKLYQT
jgi:hypothetical protein